MPNDSQSSINQYVNREPDGSSAFQLSGKKFPAAAVSSPPRPAPCSAVPALPLALVLALASRGILAALSAKADPDQILDEQHDVARDLEQEAEHELEVGHELHSQVGHVNRDRSVIFDLDYNHDHISFYLMKTLLIVNDEHPLENT